MQDPSSREFTLFKSYTFVFGALTFGRRWSLTPGTLSTRVIFFLTTMTGLLVQWQWKGGIISQLTVSRSEMPFDDLESLYERGA